MNHVIGKKVLMDDNLFLLLRKREDYLPTTFDYIFGKYCEQMLFYTWLGEWLDDNLKKHVKNTDEDMERSFAKQREIFDTHKKEIKKHFKEELERLDNKLKQHFNLKISTRPEFPKDISGIKKIVLPKQVEHDEKQSKKDKLAELKEFTKGYADGLILDKVFNFNTDKTKTKGHEKG